MAPPEPTPGPPKRVIEASRPIASHCDCSAFSSGEPALDTWLKRNALKSQASGAARTYVIAAEQTVVGYYALAVGSVSRRRNGRRPPQHARSRAGDRPGKARGRQPLAWARARRRTAPGCGTAHTASRRPRRHPRDAGPRHLAGGRTLLSVLRVPAVARERDDVDDDACRTGARVALDALVQIVWSSPPGNAATGASIHCSGGRLGVSPAAFLQQRR